MRFALAWTLRCCGALSLAFKGAGATRAEAATIATASAADTSAALYDIDLSSYDTNTFREERKTEVLGYRPVPLPKNARDLKVFDPIGGVTRNRTQDGAIDNVTQTGVMEPVVNSSMFVFEGLNSDTNANLLGYRVVPPDPVGAVGKDHYVQMTNVAFAVFDKNNGTIVNGPFPLGVLWDGFAIADCANTAGDPIALYDQFEERWILTQFSTGCLAGGNICYNCLAISETEDPTGRYHRYAFPSQPNPFNAAGTSAFPDYPKWGVWGDSYILTTRDFYFSSSQFFFAVSVFAIKKADVVGGQMDAQFMRFTIGDCVAYGIECPEGVKNVPFSRFTNGLLPPDVDGNNPPPPGTAAPLVSTTDNGVDFSGINWPDFDAFNIWELSVDWCAGTGSLDFVSQPVVANYSSTFGRRLVPQPGVGEENYLDALSQFIMYRLAYRNEKAYDSMVVCQSVLVPVDPPQPRRFGVRWYEVRRTKDPSGGYKIYQQGTYAPNDPTSRVMGSIAKDGNGNIALGFAVSDGISVYPGIRVTGRLEGDQLGKMTLGESTVVDGGGPQVNSFNRLGDYSSMNIDPEDDCTFWYTNEYIPQFGAFNWRTKIASFKLPGCKTSKTSKTSLRSSKTMRSRSSEKCV